MSLIDPSGTDWTDRELALIVADYFDMLSKELSGESFNKSRRNAALQELTGRSHGSIERKHQNISAVLRQLGMPWIVGYRPLSNFQGALLKGIERFLEDRGEFLVGASPTAASAGAAEPGGVYFESPPAKASAESSEPEPLKRLVRKFDPAARDARNRSLGRQGEETILLHERSRLKGIDRADLARKVKWISAEEGDGAGFDILSFDETGKERLLEVKTTIGYQLTPFFLSENEHNLSQERPDAFRLVRLYDFPRRPRAFELIPPLESSVLLRTAIYRASFDG
jgi:hypothetical protein